MSVLQPVITSILNGNITIRVDSPAAVAAVFDQLTIHRASSQNGPFTIIQTISLSNSSSYTYCDTNSLPTYYYKVQFYNSSTMVTSVFSELAQETAIYKEYSLPVSTASYPAEIALSEQDREIVESIRITLGDLGLIEHDYYDANDTTQANSCASQVSADRKTWEIINFKGWPQRVILNGVEKTSLTDPLVIGYRYLTFSGTSAVVTGTLSIYYNHFRFSDREILLAYDRARNLLVSCGLAPSQITTEMLIMQASILLLEGEVREDVKAAVRVRDGDTEYDNTGIIRSRTGDLEDLKRKLKELLDCARAYASYGLMGVRID